MNSEYIIRQPGKLVFMVEERQVFSVIKILAEYIYLPISFASVHVHKACDIMYRHYKQAVR